MQYPQRADNMIITGGLPLWMSFEAASAILPGDLVEFNNAAAGDCTIKAGTVDSTEVVAVADISVQSSSTYRGGSRTHAYAAADQVRCFRGPVTCMLRLYTAETIQCGEMLQPAASGEVKAYICATDESCQRIAQSLETLTANTLTFQWIHVALERFG